MRRAPSPPAGDRLPARRLARRRAVGPTRIAIMAGRGSARADARDLAVIRRGVRSRDVETAVIAVRALGRLERPALIPDIAPSLRSPMAEVRAEAANALGQAAQPLKNRPADAGASPVDSALGLLASRLKVDDAPEVRAAIDETIGRLPYTTAAQAARAEAALLDTLDKNADSIPDRLGVAKGFEALSRITRKFRPLGPDAAAALGRAGRARSRAGRFDARRARAPSGPRIARLGRPRGRPDAGARGRRRRRAGAPARDARWPRRATARRGAAALTRGLADASPMVRWEALRGVHVRDAASACAPSLAAVADTRRARRARRARPAGGLRLVARRRRRARPRRHRSLRRRVAARLAPRRARDRRAGGRGARARRGDARTVQRVVDLAAADVRGAGRGHPQGSAHARAAGGRRRRQRVRGGGGRAVEARRPRGRCVCTWRLWRGAGTRRFARRRGRWRASTSRDAVPALEQAWQRLVEGRHDNSHDARDAIAGHARRPRRAREEAPAAAADRARARRRRPAAPAGVARARDDPRRRHVRPGALRRRRRRRPCCASRGWPSAATTTA